MTARPQTQQRRVLLAAILGNTLEWYDFAVYAFMSAIIAKLFFPSNDPRVSLLLSVGVFGVGFLMRPIGAVVLGVLADRAGRKTALLASFSLMALGTLAIGLTPTFAQIGLAAPVVIIVARLLQGLSAGGEIGGATAMLTENAPPRRRGFFGSWQSASQSGALLLGSMAAAATSALLTGGQLSAWGWRIPFLLSLLIVPLGIFIRLKISEPDQVRRRLDAETSSPLWLLWREHRRSVARGCGISVLWTVSSYFFLIYFPLFAVTELKIAPKVALFSNCIGLAASFVTAPIAGYASDRVGRFPVMITAAVLMLVLVFPAFTLLSRFPGVGPLIAFQVTFAVIAACFTGPAATALTELFPIEVRSSGMAIAYNLAVTIFGGFAPLIATSLVSLTGTKAAPAFYVIFAAGLSLATILLSFRRPKTDTATAIKT